MKRIVALLSAIAICMSIITFVSAEDSFSVKHNIIQSSEEFCGINVTTPYFEGFTSSDEINRTIRNWVADSIGEAKTTAKSIKQLSDENVKNGGKPFVSAVSLDTTYDYVKNGDILSLQLITHYYSGGAHPISWVNTITANTATGELYTLQSLFKDDSDYAAVLTEQIIAAINKNPEKYFDDYAQTITNKNGDFKFYIDGDKLVIYFDLYEIAPYSSGMNRFVFNAKDLKNILKDEVYNSVKAAKPMGAVRLNGSDIHSKNTGFINDDGIMLPLRDIAEALGYKVEWNQKEGAIVAGGSIKPGVNSYWTTGKEPVSIIAPVLINDITFVPMQYFTGILGENVAYDYLHFTYISDNGPTDCSDTVIRAYTRNDIQNNFDNLIVQFEKPLTDEECITMYAEAVKNRNGAVQYGLLTDKLREENYQYYKESSFVTGVSSPWVESYDIKKSEGNLYKITFHLKTSSPTALPDMITTAALVKDGEFWRISSLATVEE